MTSLNVGDRVTLKVLNPMWKFKHVYASYVHVPEFNVYEGQLLAPQRGDPAGTFRMTSGDPSYPVRLIDVDRVVGMEDHAPSLKNETETWTVVGSRGSKYNVTRTGKSFECSCAGFGYRRQCRHVNELRDKLMREAA